MNFDVLEHHLDVQQVAHDVLARCWVADQPADLPSARRREIHQLIARDILPTLRNGSDKGSTVDLVNAVFAMEELGSAVYNGPIAETILVLHAIDASSHRDRLPSTVEGLGSGEAAAALALIDDERDDCIVGASSLEAGERSRWTLSGTKDLVRDGDFVDLVVCSARTGGEQQVLMLVDVREADGCIQADDRPALDGHLPSLTFRDCPAWLLAEGDEYEVLVESMRTWGAMLACGEMIGIVRRLLELCVEHGNNRHQFGRPIGSFQALQHDMVNMAVVGDVGRLLVWRAAWSLTHEGTAAAGVEHLGVAQAWLAKGARDTYSSAHQIHGAKGFTWDHGLHRFTRRAKALEALYWDEGCARERVLAAAGIPSGRV